MISETAPPSGAAAEAAEQARVDAIVASGPIGAMALAGIGVVLVLAIWFAFYFIVFLPRT